MLLSLLQKMLKTSWIAILFSMLGCGVKGDPLPPEQPAQIGRGQPTYQKATEKIQLQKYSPADDQEKEDKESDDE